MPFWIIWVGKVIYVVILHELDLKSFTSPLYLALLSFQLLKHWGFNFHHFLWYWYTRHKGFGVNTSYNTSSEFSSHFSCLFDALTLTSICQLLESTELSWYTVQAFTCTSDLIFLCLWTDRLIGQPNVSSCQIGDSGAQLCYISTPPKHKIVTGEHNLTCYWVFLSWKEQINLCDKKTMYCHVLICVV